MSKMQMNEEYLAYKARLDFLLNEAISKEQKDENPLYEAMDYGLSTPGKRIRGALLLAFCERLSVPKEEAEPFAVALEMIHAYSLVHDDMPEMDNDSYRRGMPTCHKKFGSAFALLAGDGILNYAMEYLLAHRAIYKAELFMNALEALFEASGCKGMLGGQAEDKIGEEKELNLSELLSLHRHKTGALLEAPAKIALALANCPKNDFLIYCRHLGLAFQIKDDLLDVEGVAEELGKETGKDEMEQKSTFVSLLGVDGARSYLNDEIDAALAVAGEDLLLCWLASYTANRNK